MSWGRGLLLHCQTIRGYPQAQRHFESRGPVRSKRWAADQRPLAGTQEKWFRLVQGPNADHYDLEAYGLPVIRYLRPEADGGYTVLLRGRNIARSREFIARMGWATWRNALLTPGGLGVFVPLAGSGPFDGWAARLVFDKYDKLLVGMSEHATPYVMISNDSDKLKRKELLQTIQPVLDLLMLRMPTFHADSTISGSRGGAFGGIADQLNARQAAKVVLRVAETKGMVPEDLLSTLLPYCQEVYNVALSKAVCVEERMAWRHEEAGAGRAMVSEGAFRTALRASLVRYSGLSEQSGKRYLPKFPTELPKKYWFD